MLIDAIDATYPPYENIAQDGHTIVGSDPDLSVALAKVLKIKIKNVNVKFAQIIPGLTDGKYDMGMSSFIDTVARQKKVDFVDYEQGHSGLMVKAGSSKKYPTLDALCGATVAVENATTQQGQAQDQAKKCAADGKPKLTVQTFSTQNGVNLAVSSGRADVCFADAITENNIIKQSHGQFTRTGPLVKDAAPTGIGFPKDSGLTKAFQAAFDELIQNGTYAKIMKKWGLQSEEIPKALINVSKS